MVQNRARLDDLLSAKLPGFVSRNESQGRWRPASEWAGWKLEPAGDSFWLMLTGRSATALCRDPLVPSGHWPWPLKAARQGSGSPWAWCAELRLQGSSQDAHQLSELIVQIERWLTEGTREQDHRSRRSIQAEPAEADALLLAEAFGNELQPGGGSECYRLPIPDGPTLEFRPPGNGGRWQVDCVLARSSEPLPSPSLAALSDFLGVANARFHGCRAVLEIEPAIAAMLECRIPRPAFAVEALQEVEAILTEAGRLLAPACQVLCDVPDAGTAYAACLLGGKSVRA